MVLAWYKIHLVCRSCIHTRSLLATKYIWCVEAAFIHANWCGGGIRACFGHSVFATIQRACFQVLSHPPQWGFPLQDEPEAEAARTPHLITLYTQDAPHAGLLSVVSGWPVSG